MKTTERHPDYFHHGQFRFSRFLCICFLLCGLSVAAVACDSSANKTTTTPTGEPATLATLATSTAPAKLADDDWPQFRGWNRTNISAEMGLISSWPKEGPRLLWTARQLGEGYSTVSVVGDRIYTLGTTGNDSELIVLDSQSGKIEYRVRIGNNREDNTGNGPRSTPTYDNGYLYCLGEEGDLVCVNDATGKVVWRKNLLKEYQGENIVWGLSESPLIDGNKVICTPGGQKGSIVALDKMTGREIWAAVLPTAPKAAYASAIAIEVGGVRQYVNFCDVGLFSVRASDGHPLWANDGNTTGTANCPTPLFYKDHVFSATGYGKGGLMLKLNSQGNQTKATEVYRTRKMINQHGGMVLIGNYLYGSNERALLCIDVMTGKVMWQDRSVGKGSVVAADGHIIARSEKGPIALVEANPQNYVEKGRFEQPAQSGRQTWAHPVVAQGKLFLRDGDYLFCYELKAN